MGVGRQFRMGGHLHTRLDQRLVCEPDRHVDAHTVQIGGLAHETIANDQARVSFMYMHL